MLQSKMVREPTPNVSPRHSADADPEGRQLNPLLLSVLSPKFFGFAGRSLVHDPAPTAAMTKALQGPYQGPFEAQ